jgi:hypothetical protein
MSDSKKPRLTAADFNPEVLRLFDQYVHGGIDRRGFLDRASRYAVAGGTTAAGLLAALAPRKLRPATPETRASTSSSTRRPATARAGLTWRARRARPVRCRWC